MIILLKYLIFSWVFRLLLHQFFCHNVKDSLWLLRCNNFPQNLWKFDEDIAFQIFKFLNNQLNRRIFRNFTHIWHVYISESMYWLDTLSLKVWWKSNSSWSMIYPRLYQKILKIFNKLRNLSITNNKNWFVYFLQTHNVWNFYEDTTILASPRFMWQQ